MKEIIAQWFAWLKTACTERGRLPSVDEVAVSPKDGQLSHVYSDGKQIWASDGYSLHALDVAIEKSGQVTVSEEGLFHVDETDDLPSFASALPQGEPIASIVVSAERLKQAAAGQEGFVRLKLYGNNQVLELSSGGKYALVMPVLDVQEWQFWRPNSGLSDENRTSYP